jgi:hypothetical protein
MSSRAANLAYLAARVGCIRLGTAGTLACLSDTELERMVSLIREAEAEQGADERQMTAMPGGLKAVGDGD